MADEPNQGATGDAPAGGATGEAPGATADPPTAAAGAHGESPLGVDSEHDAFAERPEIYVGAAFVGGLVVAQILRRLTR